MGMLCGSLGEWRGCLETCRKNMMIPVSDQKRLMRGYPTLERY